MTPYSVGNESMPDFDAQDVWKDCASQGGSCSVDPSTPVMVCISTAYKKQVTHVAHGSRITFRTDFFWYNPDKDHYKTCELDSFNNQMT